MVLPESFHRPQRMFAAHSKWGLRDYYDIFLFMYCAGSGIEANPCIGTTARLTRRRVPMMACLSQVQANVVISAGSK